MYKLTFKKRVWIVKQYKKGVLPYKNSTCTAGLTVAVSTTFLKNLKKWVGMV